MGSMARKSIETLSRCGCWESEQFNARVIISRHKYIPFIRTIYSIDIVSVAYFWPYTLRMPSVNSRIGRPTLISITNRTIWLHLLVSLTTKLIVEYLTAIVVDLEDLTVHREINAQDSCRWPTQHIRFFKVILDRIDDDLTSRGSMPNSKYLHIVWKFDTGYFCITIFKVECWNQCFRVNY